MANINMYIYQTEVVLVVTSEVSLLHRWVFLAFSTIEQFALILLIAIASESWVKFAVGLVQFCEERKPTSPVMC